MHLFISSEITYNLFAVRFFLFTDNRSQHPPPTRPLKTSPHRKETASERMNNYSVMSFSVPGAFNPIKLKSLFLTSHERTYSISFTPTISSCSTRSYCLELQSVARMRNSRMQIETLILRDQEAPQCPVTWNGLIGKNGWTHDEIISVFMSFELRLIVQLCQVIQNQSWYRRSGVLLSHAVHDFHALHLSRSLLHVFLRSRL